LLRLRWRQFSSGRTDDYPPAGAGAQVRIGVSC
jgi:hypothetical protein